jgi:hypothetical protein
MIRTVRFRFIFKYAVRVRQQATENSGLTGLFRRRRRPDPGSQKCARAIECADPPLLWSKGPLAGSPAEGATLAFLWVILPIVAVPCGYVFGDYIYTSKKSENLMR